MNHAKKSMIHIYSMNHTFIKYKSFSSMKPRLNRDYLAQKINKKMRKKEPHAARCHLHF
jgi:hypothetical protein